MDAVVKPEHFGARTQASAEPRPDRFPPGDLAIWIFILAELAAFAAFFGSYAFTRMQHVELFDHYQLTLDRTAALINTLR